VIEIVLVLYVAFGLLMMLGLCRAAARSSP